MKKIFTLIAAVFMAAGAQAQTLTFDNVTDATAEFTLEQEGFKAVCTMGAKGTVEEKSLNFIPWGQQSNENVETFTHQLKPGGSIAKTSGERSIVLTLPSAGKLYVYARTGSASATDRTLTVQQSGVNLVDGQVIMDANSYSVTDAEDKTTYYYWTVACDVKAGTAYVMTSASINFSAFKFVSSGEGGGGSETTGLPSYSGGTMVGNWSIVGTKAGDGSLEYSSKYNKNTTPVTTITFPSSATSEGAWQYAVKVEGEFKTGDVITIQPFTVMSTKDFTGGSKYANILLYGEDIKQIADLTGSAAGALTVTDGHEEEGAPKEFMYTLEADQTNLYFTRGGNTRINLMRVEIKRNASSIARLVVQPTTSNDAIYNLAGQKVNADYKGLIIKNGRKLINK